MINLKTYEVNSDDFFDSVLNSKRNSKKDPDYKERVEGFKPNVRTHFSDYDLRFSNGTLADITLQDYDGQVKKDLLKLYSYRNSVIQELKTKVTTSDAGRVINTCQNCTINSVNSLDHIVPKEEASEFSVHPKNLFPSCTECNDKKNKFWRDGGQFIFLNLYTFTLPNVQYLFPQINYTNGIPIVKFEILNSNNITQNVFDVIERHYDRLDLQSRFTLKSDEVISELECNIGSLKGLLPRQQVLDSIVDSENQKRIIFGHNYWKSLLTIELTRCVDFMDDLFK